MDQSFFYFLSEFLSFPLFYVLGSLIVYFIYRASNLENHGCHVLGMLFLCCLLHTIFTITGLPTFRDFHFEIRGSWNFIPFAEGTSGMFQYIANTIMFLPVGFALPLLWQQFLRPFYAIGAGFLLSLSIELLQLFTFRATDIDDLITNTLGTALGWILFWVFSILMPKFLKKFQISWTCHKFAGMEYLICIAVTFLFYSSCYPFIYDALFQIAFPA